MLQPFCLSHPAQSYSVCLGVYGPEVELVLGHVQPHTAGNILSFFKQQLRSPSDLSCSLTTHMITLFKRDPLKLSHL